MDRRTKIIIIITIVLLIILAVLLFWMRLKDQEPEVVVVIPDEVVGEVEAVEETGPVEMMPEESARDTKEVSVETIAKTFAERYTSYSNESDFANLYDLFPLMTASFQEEIEQMIASTEVDDIYYGITSQVISTQVTLGEEETTAEVQMNLQREKALGTPQNTEVVYEVLILTMVKESGSWKVDGTAWE